MHTLGYMLARAIALLLSVVTLGGCAASPSEDASADDSTESDLVAGGVPSECAPGFIKALQWFSWLDRNEHAAYVTSPRSESDARRWGGGFDPVHDPIFAHNEILIEGVSPADALALLASGRSDTYYANSSAATDCTTHQPVTLTLGRSYCWTTFGNEQHMKIVELESGPDEAAIAWQGGTIGIEVYHRWIMRRTATGTKVVTEEIERGLLPRLSIYNTKMNPGLHAGHELWLRGMRDRLRNPR